MHLVSARPEKGELVLPFFMAAHIENYQIIMMIQKGALPSYRSRLLCSSHSVLKTLLLVLSLICLPTGIAQAQTIDWRSNLNSLNLTWTGSGDLTGTSTGCIRSRTNNPRRPLNYGIMAIQSFAGDIVASDGSNQLIMDLDFEGVSLQDGGFTGTVFRGATNCNTVDLDVRIAESQLENLPEGTYTTAGQGTYGRVIICATPGGATNCDISPSSPYDDSNIEITVNIPAYTRLFNVGDIHLPPYDGMSSTVIQDMLFCVKSTSSAAGYTLTATSDTHHVTATDFAMSKSGGETIPYTLLFSASTNPAAGSALVSGSPAGPFTGSRQNSCGGGDNASMRVQVAGTDIQTASPGNYSGQITILVEPN